jgi:hypothetical protein
MEVQAVQRIRFQVVAATPTAAIGADSSASIGSFIDLPFREGTAQMVLTRDELQPMTAKQHIDEGEERVLGKRSATLTVTVNLAPTGTAAVTGTSAITSPLGRLLKAVMGGEDLAAGSTSATSTAVVLKTSTASHASRWAAGKIVGWSNGTFVEWRGVEAVSPTSGTVTLKHGFSAAPSAAAALYNAATYYMTADPDTTIDMLVEGLDSDDRFLLCGGQAVGGMSITFDLTGAAIPSVTFNLTFPNWYAAGETGSAITGTLGTASYSATSPIVGEAGEFRSWTVGASTYVTTSRLHVSAVTWEPHITYVPVTSPSGRNTVWRWKKGRNTDSPVQGSFTIPYEDTTWFANRNSLADKNAMQVAGVAAGAAVILDAPTIQILNPQRAADASQIAAQVLMWKGRRDTDVASSTNDLAKSPFRVHLG